MISLYVALLGPIEEEVVYRGLLQSVLTDRLARTGVSASKDIIAIGFVSVLFMALHFQLGVFTAVGALVGGLILGELKRCSGSLLPGVLCHIAINASGLPVGYH